MTDIDFANARKNGVVLSEKLSNDIRLVIHNNKKCGIFTVARCVLTEQSRWNEDCYISSAVVTSVRGRDVLSFYLPDMQYSFDISDEIFKLKEGVPYAIGFILLA